MIRKLPKKGQNWSLDLILGIVIFMLILSIFYLLISKGNESDVTILKQNAGRIMNYFDEEKEGSNYAILKGNTINVTKLKQLYNNGDYNQIKRNLGITGEFCIVLEDSNDRIIVMQNDSASGMEIYGFGDDGLNVSGCLCGQSCP